MDEIVPLCPTALDRSLLHVFVFGPAVGEAVAVALPDRGWILVDGCRVVLGDEDRFPALELYEKLRVDENDAVELLVWTHPHTDHYLGILECVETYSPRRVGMTLVESPIPGSVSAELQALRSHPLLPADLRLQDVFKHVRSTLERLFLYWIENPGSRYPLSADAPILQLGSTRVQILAPGLDALKEFYALPTSSLRSALGARANEFSIVLALEFGTTQVLLGGDLPYLSTQSRTIVPHGWREVLERSPGCAEHDVFKVSHHGSAQALSPSFHRRDSPEREWLVSPFVKEHLPRPGDGPDGGLRQILHRVSSVRLTSSFGLYSPAQPGEAVKRSQLAQALANVEASGLPGGLRPHPAKDVFDFGWGLAVDSEQNVRMRFAGAQALTVIEG